MLDVGIDKFRFNTKEFLVKSNNMLSIQRGKERPTGEVDPNGNFVKEFKEKLLFKTDSGLEKWGSGAYINTPNYSVDIDIDKAGFSVHYNPSKILHPYKLINDNTIIKDQFNQIRKELKDAGIIFIGDEGLRMSRIDIAKNCQMDRPLALYDSVFSQLRGSRMQSTSIDNTWTFRNKSRQTTFYDKVSELINGNIETDILPNTLRGEVRALKSEAVARMYRINTLQGLINTSPEYRIEKYKENLISSVFRSVNSKDQLQMFATDYDREIEIMKQFKRVGRGAVNKYMSIKGIDNVIEQLGNINNFRMLLIDSGFKRNHAFRESKKLEDLLIQTRFLTPNKKAEKISLLYDEVYQKFVA